MPVLSTPDTTNTGSTTPNAAEQTRTFPNGSDALDRRGNPKKLKKSESAEHTISSNTLKIVSYPVWFWPKKKIAENLKVALHRPNSHLASEP